MRGPTSSSVQAPAGVAAARPSIVQRGPARRSARRRAAWRRRLRGLVGVAIAFALWLLVTGAGLVSAHDLPSIGAVASALSADRSVLLSDVGTTLESMFIGLGIASLAGAVLGVAVGLSAWADAATGVIVRMMRPMPSLALIPVAILVAGLGTEMTAGLVAFAAFWPVFINARYAARRVEPRFLETGRSVGLGSWGLVWRVVLPSVAGAIATGIRIAVGMAIVVTVSVELVAGTGGLGGYVLSAEQGDAIPRMYAGIIVGGIVGWLLNVGLHTATRRLLPWEARTEAGRRG